jgi:hypothetical protein
VFSTANHDAPDATGSARKPASPVWIAFEFLDDSLQTVLHCIPNGYKVAPIRVLSVARFFLRVPSCPLWFKVLIFTFGNLQSSKPFGAPNAAFPKSSRRPHRAI